jgi:hypothetical protein
MKQMLEAHSPEPQMVAEPVEAHIMRKRGKFHAHVVMSDGGEHHMPPHATMHEAHAALAPHMGTPGEETMPMEASNEPQQEEIQA